VSETDLRRALQGTAAPDELGAERRAWAVLRSAYAETEPSGSRRRPARLVLALAAALALVAAAISPPGRAVGGWVREAVGIERVGGREDARPALASLPAKGSLLVLARTGAWVVRDDGSKRRLGAYRDATWSPQGLHVAATRGRRLVALTPEGDVRWTLTKARPVHHPAWSPSGFRIAYGAGGDLRVVNGDGEPDRLLARGAAPGSWSWKPDADRHILAYATRGGAMRVVDVDTRRSLWRTRRGPPVGRLDWSADGTELLAVSPQRLRTFRAPGERRLNLWAPLPIVTAAFAPRGRRIAYAVTGSGVEKSRVMVYNGRFSREAFSGAGRFGELEWSPDGRWLLVAWPSADQWLFLRMPRVPRIDAVSDIRREFDPGGAGGGSFPRLSGWCCLPEAP
jgi:hypothetical protein